jgi:hypothetical protein
MVGVEDHRTWFGNGLHYIRFMREGTSGISPTLSPELFTVLKKPHDRMGSYYELNIFIMNPDTNQNVCKSGCGCAHHWVGAVAVLLIGVSFLVAAFSPAWASANSYAWPILLIIAAAGKLCRCCRK